MEALSPNVFGRGKLNVCQGKVVGSSTHPAGLCSCYNELQRHFGPPKQVPGMTWDLPWSRDLR